VPKGAENSSYGKEELTTSQREHLTTYLNDHLAGAATVINLLERLEHTKAGQEVKPFVIELRDDVAADRATLEGLMHGAQIARYRHRTVLAWLIEKLTRSKLRLDDAEDWPLHLLEALELVETGIEGKRELWRALAVTAGQTAGFQAINFDHLLKRAEEQHRKVENVRVEAAKRALARNGEEAPA
jgi:hypothetical protein